MGARLFSSTPRRLMVLTPRQKLVLQLYHHCGVSQVDIARRLGVSPTAVCSLLKRGRQRILDLVDDHEGIDIENLMNAELARPPRSSDKWDDLLPAHA